QVSEPESGQVVDDTFYAYDVQDKLATVSQGVQARNFTYDAFGFLRTEATPEAGTVNYSTYDALGDVLTECHAPPCPNGTAINRSYDAAGRATLVTANEWTGLTYVSRTYLSNTYDEASASLSKGRLTTRVGTNYATSPSVLVTDAFVYGNASGRLSS